VNFGPLEHDIRRVPGVLALQFAPTEVFVLVEPSADVAQVTAAVEGLLAVAAENRRVSVIGGTSAAVVWPRRRVAVLVGAAAASVFAVGAAAAMAGGVFHSSPAARTAISPARPRTTPATTPLTSTKGEGRAKKPPAPPVSTPPVVPVVVPAPQIIRISLPAPLPAAAAALVRDVILHPPVVAPPVVKPPPVMKPPPVVKPPVVTPPPVVPPEDIKSDRREHCEDERPGKGHDRDGDHEHDICR
jgi:hypothetical protein